MSNTQSIMESSGRLAKSITINNNYTTNNFIWVNVIGKGNCKSLIT
ncbi:TPA: hypothetical protein ACVT6Y_002731 [Clostridioides difficile]